MIGMCLFSLTAAANVGIGHGGDGAHECKRMYFNVGSMRFLDQMSHQRLIRTVVREMIVELQQSC